MLESEFNSHAVWSELETAREIFAQIDQGKSLDTMRAIDPIRALLAVTSGRDNVDPNLVSDAMMSGLNQSWNQINQYLSVYSTNASAQYLANANVQADVLRGQLSTFPMKLAGGNAQANLTRAFNQYRSELDKSRDRLNDRLQQAVDAAASREADLSASIDHLQANIATSVQQVAMLEERIAQGEIRMDTSLTKNNETFISGQTTRDKDFKLWLADQEKNFEKLAAPHLTSIEDADADALRSLEVIASLRTSTVEMSSLAAGDILADKYGEYARSERIASYVAYGVGVVAALGSIAVILFAFGTLQNSLDWQRVALKFGLAAAAGGIGAVAFRFGGQAVRRATSFKRQELELRALQPFLKDVVGADVAKTAFLERAFGRAWEESASRRSETEVNDSMVKLMTSIVQNLPRS